jgi:hypothetical protein
MLVRRFLVAGALAACILAAPAASAQELEPGVPVFRSQSHLVLLPFRVARGKNYVTNLGPSDVILLEDGKPHEFTIFDSPASQGRLPVELALLFDTDPPIPPLWDPREVFRFIPQWSDSLSRAVLQRGREKDQIELRISVYRCSGELLYRSSPATNDPPTLTRALRTLLGPLPASPGGVNTIALNLPPGRERVATGRYTEDYVTSPFFRGAYRGWPMEAAMGLLNEVSAAQDRVARILVMFSEGIGATTTIPEDIGNAALDLGIPMYPIATNYKHRVRRFPYPRNYFRMHEFEALGKMTGGRASEFAFVDAQILRTLLDDVIGDALAQYVVGFAPDPGDRAPQVHNLEVRLASKSGELEGGKRRATY